MPNPARKNYGNYTPKKGDIVCVFGRQSEPFKVLKNPDPSRDPEVPYNVEVQSIHGRKTVLWTPDIREAKPEEVAQFPVLLKEYADRRKEQNAAYKKLVTRSKRGNPELPRAATTRHTQAAIFGSG